MAGWSTSYPHDQRRIATDLRAGWTAWRWRSSWRPPGWRRSVSTGWNRELADPLGLLTGGSRIEERHRSVRSALDWSFGLLSEEEQAVLRRSSVFASAFTGAAAADVAGFAPLTSERVTRPSPASPSTTSWRWSTPRRHPLPDARDDPAVRRRADGPRGRAGRRTRRHLSWCLTTATRLARRDRRGVVRRGGRRPQGRARLVGRRNLRGGPTHISWPCGWRSSPTPRGWPSEAQERYEEAAALAADPPKPPRAPPRGGRRVGPPRRQRGDRALPRRRRGRPPRRVTPRPPHSSWPRRRRSSQRAGHHVRAACPGRMRALLAEAHELAAGDSTPRGGHAHCRRPRPTSSTRRPATWPSAPSSWPTGSATLGWRATPSTS